MKVGVAISSYKSDDEVILLINKIITESWPIEGIVVVNSLGSKKLEDYLKSLDNKNFEYFNSDINLGSAGNLKKRLLLASSKDWDFVLALNHDALVTKEALQQLMRYDYIPNVGALYPLKYFPNKGFYDYSGTKEVGPWRSFGKKITEANQMIPCYWSSSNGALYSLEPIRRGIAPNGELWMGWEDYLYGLDLKKSGYKQFLISNAICEDGYEFKEHKIGFFKFMMASKPAWYNYYNTRNLWLICLYFHPSFIRILRITVRSFFEIIYICFGLGGNNIKYSIILKIKGFLHALSKITGKKDL